MIFYTRVVLGIAQIIIGLLCIPISMISFLVEIPYSTYYAIGFIGGVFICLAGTLCICAAHNRSKFSTKCGALLLNISSFFFALFLTICSFIGLR